MLIVPALFVIFPEDPEKITPLKWEDTDNEGIENEIEQYTPLIDPGQNRVTDSNNSDK